MSAGAERLAEANLFCFMGEVSGPLCGEFFLFLWSTAGGIGWLSDTPEIYHPIYLLGI